MEAEPRPSHVRLRRLAEEFLLLGFLFALFALGNMVHDFFVASYLAVLCPVFGVAFSQNWILWEMLRFIGRNVWLDSGYRFCISTWRFGMNFAHFLR